MRAKHRVILAGAGHANIAALRMLSKNPPSADITIVNDGHRAWYTGALPALIRGDIPPEKAYVDVSRLAQSCGARFVDGKVMGFENNLLKLAGADPLPYDVLAITVGSIPNGGVKPVGRFLDRLAAWSQLPRADIGILGAGVAAVELALALKTRLGTAGRISILARGPLLETAPGPARRTIFEHLKAAKIQILPGSPILMDEIVHAYTPDPILHVRETLQLPFHYNVFAAGDCALFPTPLPRSGAIAVRQGKTLAANIRNTLAGAPLRAFRPPRHTLVILSLSATTATAWYGKLFWTGRTAMALKNKLDSAWIDSFGSPAPAQISGRLPGPAPTGAPF